MPCEITEMQHGHIPEPNVLSPRKRYRDIISTLQQIPGMVTYAWVILKDEYIVGIGGSSQRALY
jgi:hypothetical protein